MQRSRRPRVVHASPARASLAALGAFCVIALIDEPSPLDLAAYEFAARHHSRALELIQRPLEVFGLPGVYIPAAIILARELRRRGHRGDVRLVNTAMAGWIALRLSRLVIHRPRPPRPPGRGPKSESTFPSGHTTGLTALAIVAAEVLENEQILTSLQARALRIGLPLAIGMNRVFVREHWLTDVLGGWALGVAVALAFPPGSEWQQRQRGLTRTQHGLTRTRADSHPEPSNPSCHPSSLRSSG